ncbi:MAG: twin-arginine translocase subunit TatC [Bacteroidetes bacterium]|nr:twin-arginine translocase subunit TatC [Bacteroidota bacterium]MBI3483161.1 twin-arginine translocase subunit TatC [Bacteroidota bacterium]
MSEEKEMAFLDHLEELRWHVVRSVAAIFICMIIGFIFQKWIFDNIVFAPANINFPTFKWMCKFGELVGAEESLCAKPFHFKIQSRNMTGQFMMSITASFVIGLVIAFPYVFWEIWRFVKPALYKKEKNSSRGAVFAVSFLFLLGVAFGYYILSPMTIWFLSTYSISDVIVNEFDITSYVSTVVGMVLGCGLLFQFPVAVYFLTKIGMLTPQFMRKFRKHAIVVILILGAIITPSPDPFSQLLISLPIYMLFEISIFISAMVVKQKQREEEAELKADQQQQV